MQANSSSGTMIIILMIIAYIVFTAWLTIKLRSKNPSEFMSGGRATPAMVIGVLLMAEFIGAKSTVGVAQAAFDQGLAATWAVLSAAIGFVLFGMFLAGRLHQSGEVTISGAISKSYGPATQKIVSLIMIYALLLVNLGNYISGAASIATIGHISLPIAALVIAVVSTFYFMLGGMKSVAYVSLGHTALQYLGVFIVLGTALYMTKGIAPLAAKLPNFYFTASGHMGWSSIIAFALGNIGAVFSTQFIMQAIASTKDAKAARHSAYFAACLCIPISIALGLIGVAAKYLFPGMKSLFALPVFMEHMGVFPASIVAIGLTASVFLSVSTVALGIASLVVRDFYVPHYKPTPDQEMRTTRVLSLIIGFLPLALVFLAPGLLKLSFFTRALRLSIALIAMIGYYMPFIKGELGAVLGLIVAAVATTIWYIQGDPYGINNMYIALGSPFIVMVLCKYLHLNEKFACRSKLEGTAPSSGE